jgi:pyruvate/2-oxoglutarate dehydrogenase complex dihydrolipoamide dehydrogenase (E3) component
MAMRAFDFDLISIGSGPAGQRVAVQAAKLGRRAAVVEKRRAVGGVCIEYASIFAALGVSVTLVERRDRPLEFLDREIKVAALDASNQLRF